MIMIDKRVVTILSFMWLRGCECYKTDNDRLDFFNYALQDEQFPEFLGPFCNKFNYAHRDEYPNFKEYTDKIDALKEIKENEILDKKLLGEIKMHYCYNFIANFLCNKEEGDLKDIASKTAQ